MEGGRGKGDTTCCRVEMRFMREIGPDHHERIGKPTFAFGKCYPSQFAILLRLRSYCRAIRDCRKTVLDAGGMDDDGPIESSHHHNRSTVSIFMKPRIISAAVAISGTVREW